MTVPVRPGSLSGIVVLDLSQWLSGPYCTQQLADLGAEVIKVETPEGDGTRTMAPYFVRGDSAYFHSVNRTKRSIVLDLKHPDGKAVFHDLVRRADVVLDNFRPGVTARLGVDYPTLRATNSRIVACSITGFGQEGPYRDRPAYDMVVQAMSGGMSITGEVGGRPVRSGVPLGDLGAGLFAVIGVIGALQERERSGEGQFIDISMLDCQISMLSYLGVYHLTAGVVPGPQGRGHMSVPTYRSFLAADGQEVLITAITEKMWQGVCAVLGCPELIADPRFTTNADRLRHDAELSELLEARFLMRPAHEWLPLLEAASVPAAPVNTVAQALADPHVLSRNMVVSVPLPEGGELRLLGNPVKMSRTPGPEPVLPPVLGADTESVLREFLKYPNERITALQAGGAVSPREGIH